ncbi:MAG: hypothetical protein DCC75_07930 [Proteobacteria bacterium]|nr:MAG: hypothetical protein DCC75_07930 [Pseudomonadota bacterium]
MEEHLKVVNHERERDGLPHLKHAVVSLLGQFGLLAHPEASKRLLLAATHDVDALIEADWLVRSIFIEALKEYGLVYDELSCEAWIPPGSDFETIYSSPALEIRCLTPLAILTSKAVKAKERNAPLIRYALGQYGEPLARLIAEHGGDLDYFRVK